MLPTHTNKQTLARAHAKTSSPPPSPLARPEKRFSKAYGPAVRLRRREEVGDDNPVSKALDQRPPTHSSPTHPCSYQHTHTQGPVTTHAHPRTAHRQSFTIPRPLPPPLLPRVQMPVHRTPAPPTLSYSPCSCLPRIPGHQTGAAPIHSSCSITPLPSRYDCLNRREPACKDVYACACTTCFGPGRQPASREGIAPRRTKSPPRV